jgi:hypothetical protein
MKPSSNTRAKVSAALIATAFTLGACGGGDGGSASAESSDSDEAPPKVVVADAVALEADADVATNLLPDLVVDHLNDDNKVNLRNYGVNDKPTLLWMWAPF